MEHGGGKWWTVVKPSSVKSCIAMQFEFYLQVGAKRLFVLVATSGSQK